MNEFLTKPIDADRLRATLARSVHSVGSPWRRPERPGGGAWRARRPVVLCQNEPHTGRLS